MNEPALPVPDSPAMTTAAPMLLHILEGRYANARAIAASADDPTELAMALAESWATTMLGDIYAISGGNRAAVKAMATEFARELITAAVTAAATKEA